MQDVGIIHETWIYGLWYEQFVQIKVCRGIYSTYDIRVDDDSNIY